MNATNMVQGNLALKLETPAEPTFTVVQGGRLRLSAFDRKACSQSAGCSRAGPRCPEGSDDCRRCRCAHALLCPRYVGL